MSEALFWGFVSAFALVVGAIAALKIKFSHRVIGLIMAFGVGALISSVCFELVENAFSDSGNIGTVLIGLVAGALVYFFGDLLIDKYGGKNRKNMRGTSETSGTKEKSDDDNSGLAILLGTVLDGIPESMVIGLTIVQGGSVSIAMVVAVFLSNVPEGLSSSIGLLASGWKKRSIFGLWAVVVAASVFSTFIGYQVFADTSALARAFVLSFAGGAILTMLADTMIPEAYRSSGKLTGLVVVLGFCLAFAVTTVE